MPTRVNRLCASRCDPGRATAVVVLVVLGVALLGSLLGYLVLQGPDDPAASPHSTSGLTVAASQTSGPDPPVATSSDDAAVSTSQAAPASTVSPRDACTTDEPLAPPFLLDGTPPGTPNVKLSSGGDIVAWGVGTEQEVRQFLGVTISADLIDSSMEPFRSAAIDIGVIPVGDDDTGDILLDVRDNVTGCIRRYSVGPGVRVQAARSYAAAWLAAPR